MSAYDLNWQRRDEMSQASNPLQTLTEMLSSTSRDVSEDKLLSAMYGIIVGWDDGSYKELQEKHGWSNETISYQKQLHENYKESWSLYYEHLNKLKNG